MPVTLPPTVSTISAVTDTGATNVNASPPTVSTISAVTDTGATNVNASHLVTITLTTSEVMMVTGTPTLQLNDNEVAVYTIGSGSNTLTFTYTVQPSDSVADLQVTGLNLPSGATIQDVAGNNLSGGVTGDLGIQVTSAQVFQVESLFVGYFERAAAPSGEAYWLGRLDGIGGSAMTEAQIAASFSVQPEATNLYPFLVNPLSATATQVASFVNSVFEDLFNRAPTYTNGHNFWVDQLLANLGNPQVIGESIVNIISGAQGNDITTLDQKVAVATYFTDHLAASGLAFGAAALTEAQGVIAATTSDPATVVTEEHNIDIFLASGGVSPNVQLIGLAAGSAHIAAA
jgi:hypothetical protein